MKSYASFLKGLYLNILRDVEREYPEGTAEWRRDYSRLCQLLDRHGTRFFTIDLPAAGKHFDQCLASGAYTPSNLFGLARRSRRSPIPGLFQGMMIRVFQENGTIRSNVDSNAIRFLRELYYAAKKLRQECPQEAVISTVEEFFDVEEQCRNPTLEWDSDHLDVAAVGAKVHFRDLSPPSVCDDSGQMQLPLLVKEEQQRPALSWLTTLQRVCDWIVGGQFGPVDWRGLRPKHGPGAVADARVGKDNKYFFPHWPNKLEQIFPIQEYGYANYNAWEADHVALLEDQGLYLRPDSSESVSVEGLSSARDSASGVARDGRRVVERVSRIRASVVTTRGHEPPSRLIAVPKTQKGPRLIASEPTAHQWMQQALKRELERMVERSCLRSSICFADQEPSRIDALKSSQSGLRATVDLSSASDRLTCFVVERVFRSHGDLLSAFHAVRTRWLVNEIDVKSPKYKVLRKFAPMGSALTFPVQSICYALIAISSIIHARGWNVDRSSIECAARQTRVYGDDIIIPVDIIGTLTELLTELGLKVNSSKTFAKGHFRESCGMDAYAGVDVTPAYVLEVCDKTRPESVVSVVESSNNFWKKGLYDTARYLQSTVPQELRKKIPVVSTDSGAFGWLFIGDDGIPELKKRWNTRLHRWEQQVLVILDRFKRVCSGGYESLLQYLTELPSPDILWSSGVSSRTQVSLSLRWVPV
jgi:hypothetical protein